MKRKSKTLPQFAVGDRVRPLSGPYRRIDFVVAEIKGDRLSVEGDGLKLTFPAKFLKPVQPLMTYGVMSEKKPSPEGKAAIKVVIEAASKRLSLAATEAKFAVGDRAQGKTTVPPRRIFGAENVRSDYPTMTQVGILQPIGGSWKVEEDWMCPQCASKKRFVVWQGQSILAKPCLNCWELLPPELTEADQIREQIAAIQREGVIAPDHCSIERWQRSPDFVEARYKARSAIFQGKRGGMASSCYIGKVGSAEYSAALDAVDRRNRIARLQKQLEGIKYDG